jgi:WhiB family transcriptional regulator, redox-sensing transcriptional regulator
MTVPYIPAQRGTVPASADWRDSAACRHADPGLFFPAGTAGQMIVQAERAKRVCAGCPVRAACLGWALTAGAQMGVWGGTTEGERRALRARRSPDSVQRAPGQH